jgi:hypothetical protein
LSEILCSAYIFRVIPNNILHILQHLGVTPSWIQLSFCQLHRWYGMQVDAILAFICLVIPASSTSHCVDAFQIWPGSWSLLNNSHLLSSGITVSTVQDIHNMESPLKWGCWCPKVRRGYLEDNLAQKISCLWSRLCPAYLGEITSLLRKWNSYNWPIILFGIT